MMSSLANRKYSVDDYFEMERTSDVRHEYHNGEIFAMAGASFNHARIVQNISRSLGNTLEKQGICEVVGSDVRVKISDLRYLYPDVIIICGEPQLGRGDSLLNPQVIFEVLSDSTEDYDQNKKFEYYQKIPTLTDYILVSQHRILIKHHQREGDNWSRYFTTQYDQTTETLSITSINSTLSVADIYARVGFEAPPADVIDQENRG
jgi:Uma2 family endonuclease